MSRSHQDNKTANTRSAAKPASRPPSNTAAGAKRDGNSPNAGRGPFPK